MAGKMSLSPTLADVDGVKAVQIKVPVVATVTQRIESDGSYSFLIEPPGPGQEQGGVIVPFTFFHFAFSNNHQIPFDSRESDRADIAVFLSGAASAGPDFG